MPFHDPSLLTLYATPTQGVTHEKVEQAILRECEKVAKEGVTKNEFDRVLSQVLTEIAFSRDGHYEMLSSLNESIATGDWRFFFALPSTLRTVTPHMVREVAKTYLSEHSMTVGYYKATSV
jgi:zinc protease